ncbi:MAG: outer membrane protein assembly factor BamC [Rubrivivax sp.]|nr:outer membrane protein assembly factor BamC [Rubrivivax sp.]
MFSSDKIDYRSTAKTQPKSLEVPPDLSQLARDSRYQLPGGVVSAAAGAGAVAPVTAIGNNVAPMSIGQMRVMRDGSQRWLVVPVPPEQLWPQLRSFWAERGFTLTVDSAEAGVMETDWAENRAKLPQDFIRATIGRVFENLYSTGERDRFRTRVERGAAGTEIYITHRGLQEIYPNKERDSTVWTARPSDPDLEAELLTRLMVRLGAKEDAARPAVAGAAPASPAAAPRARLVAGTPAATLEVDDTFDRAWRRLGLALDRSGFSVEDRDRSAGLYFVRYVDPKEIEKGEPSFFARLFSSSSGPAQVRLRISVKADGAKTRVAVLNANGAADNSDNAQRIVAQLVNDLK